MFPALIIHADWSSSPHKRWMCAATLDAGVYRLAKPVLVGSASHLVRMAVQFAKGGGTVLGFDFPIGVPKAYARRAGIGRFLDLLPELGAGPWHEFFTLAERPSHVSIRRPFYPARPGGTRQEHLVSGLGVNSIDDLLRRCDFGNGDRNKACALFWTLGGNQVGRAALAGWRETLIPAMRELQGELGVWPFDGDIQSLLASKAAVVVETYPGDACVQLGLGAPGRGWSKRNPTDRATRASGIRRCALQMRADIRQIEGMLTDGFGASEVGEDQFDAVVGVLGMLAVILGIRTDGVPTDDAVTSVEGWIFGQWTTVVSRAS